MARVVIITPGQLGMNPRTVKEAGALSAAGHSVHVIATRLQAHLDSRDADILKNAAWTVEKIDLSEKWSRVPERLLQVAAQQLYRAAPIKALAASAHSPISRVLHTAALKAPADLYIAHYPAALPAAADAARRYGVRYVFDAEDFHSGDLPDRPENTLKKVWISKIEGSTLPGAAYITAASPLIAEAYVRTYGVQKPTVVLNAFPLSNAPLKSTDAGWAEPGPSVYWFSQTVGPGRGIETAIKAIALCKSSPHLYVRGTPARGYLDFIQDLSRRHHVADRFHILPPAPPSEMEQLASTYDLGYSGETGFSPNNTMALGNKLFSYILGGLPVLASDTPAHKIMASGLGDAMRVFSGTSELAEAIDSYLLQPERLAAARAAAWRLGQDQFNFDAEAEKLVSLVDVALSRQSRGKTTQ